MYDTLVSVKGWLNYRNSFSLRPAYRIERELRDQTETDTKQGQLEMSIGTRNPSAAQFHVPRRCAPSHVISHYPTVSTSLDHLRPQVITSWLYLITLSEKAQLSNKIWKKLYNFTLRENILHSRGFLLCLCNFSFTIWYVNYSFSFQRIILSW